MSSGIVDSEFISTADAKTPVLIDSEFISTTDAKTTGKTLRTKRIYTESDATMLVERHRDSDGFIPITIVDSDHFSMKQFLSSAYEGYSWKSTELSLRKGEKFGSLIDALEENCIEKQTICKKDTDKIIYTLPVTDYISADTFYKPDIYQPIACPKTYYPSRKQAATSQKRRRPRSWKWYEMRKQQCVVGPTIRVNGKQYSVHNIYKRSGDGFVPIHKPTDDVTLSSDEQYIRSRTTAGVALTVNFKKDTSVTGLVQARDHEA